MSTGDQSGLGFADQGCRALAAQIECAYFPIGAQDAMVLGPLIHHVVRCGFRGVCTPVANLQCLLSCTCDVNPPVRVTAVVGFPFGNDLGRTVREARSAVEMDAHEVEVPLNINRLLRGDYDGVEADLNQVEAILSDAAKPMRVVVDTLEIMKRCSANNAPDIIETACDIALQARARFVKTSTGIVGGVGATAQAVRIMRHVVGRLTGVVATGDIRTSADVQTMLDAGANFVSCSFRI